MPKKKTALDKAFEDMEKAKFRLDIKRMILKRNHDMVPFAEIVKETIQMWGRKNMKNYGLLTDREIADYIESFIEAMAGVDYKTIGE